MQGGRHQVPGRLAGETPQRVAPKHLGTTKTTLFYNKSIQKPYRPRHTNTYAKKHAKQEIHESPRGQNHKTTKPHSLAKAINSHPQTPKPFFPLPFCCKSKPFDHRTTQCATSLYHLAAPKRLAAAVWGSGENLHRPGAMREVLLFFEGLLPSLKSYGFFKGDFHFFWKFWCLASNTWKSPAFGW